MNRGLALRELACVLLIVQCASGSEPVPMFIPHPAPTRARATTVPSASETNVLRVTLSRQAADTLFRPGQRWSLPLPNGEDRVIQLSDIQYLREGWIEIRGRLEGVEGSELLLTRRGETVAGILRANGMDPVSLTPLGGSDYRLGALKPEAEPRCANHENRGVRLQDELPFPLGTPVTTGAAPTTLDLAFFYTTAAEAGAGGPEGLRALLQLSVFEANDALSRSGARVQIRPVCIMPANYEESGSLSWDLDRFLRVNDGWMDGIQDTLNVHAADIACLITEFENSNQYAGIANQLSSLDEDKQGYAVCLRPYLVGNYSLVHEIGHLLGCDHDRQNASGAQLEPWSFGTRIQIGGELYRTIMAYRPGRQFPHFSNPTVLFQGVPTGLADGPGAADNVRTINTTAPLLARVREAPYRVGFSGATVEVQESERSVRVQLALSGTRSDAKVVVETIEGTARAGADFLPVQRTLTLSPTLPDPEIEVRLLDNDQTDGSRQFALELRNPTPGLALGPISVLTVTVRDDEPDEWAVLDTRLRSRPGADGPVLATVVTASGQVVAAGAFTTFNGMSRPRIARLVRDGAVDTNFYAEVKYRVDAIALLPNDRIAIGGEFNVVKDVRLNHVAVLRTDGSPDPSFAFDPGCDGPVRALCTGMDGQLYIGGAFTNVQGASACRVARLLDNGAIDPKFPTRTGPDGEVLTLQVDQHQRVVIGGRFEHAGNFERRGVARLLVDGTIDPLFVPPTDLEGPVRTLAIDSLNRVVAGGEFTRGTTSPGRLVRLLASGAVDPSFQMGSGPDGAVLAIAHGNEGALWIAGAFSTVDGRPRRGVARLLADGAVDPTFNPGTGPDDWVFTVATASDETLVVGGLFRTVNGVPRGGLASLLSGPISKARFKEVSRDDWGLSWSATVLPGQEYEVQQSTNLHSWNTLDWVHPTGTETWGMWGLPTSHVGYLRLKRHLE